MKQILFILSIFGFSNSMACDLHGDYEYMSFFHPPIQNKPSFFEAKKVIDQSATTKKRKKVKKTGTTENQEEQTQEQED